MQLDLQNARDHIYPLKGLEMVSTLFFFSSEYRSPSPLIGQLSVVQLSPHRLD